MKTLILYYSYSGSTKTIAEELAAKESAEIAEVSYVKRPWILKAFTAGIIASIKGKAWPIQPIEVDFTGYDKLILLGPVWAGNTVPAFNAILELIPEGKSVDIKLVSGSGESACKERLEEKIKSKGSTLESFEDIKVEKKK